MMSSGIGLSTTRLLSPTFPDTESCLKIPLLPDIDLANFASLPAAAKRSALRVFDAGAPRFSYRPFRSVRPDIVNARYDLLPPAPPTSWADIAQRLSSLAKPGVELAANKPVAKSFHDFAVQTGLSARIHDYPPLKLAGIIHRGRRA